MKGGGALRCGAEKENPRPQAHRCKAPVGWFVFSLMELNYQSAQGWQRLSENRAVCRQACGASNRQSAHCFPCGAVCGRRVGRIRASPLQMRSYR
jgi:hypothetical protein